MQNTSNDPLIPAYIAYAVIILTAEHLGCKVEMSATAREVWESKGLPAAPMLALYERAAQDAKEIVVKQGLAKTADRLAEEFYRTGRFPGRPPTNN